MRFEDSLEHAVAMSQTASSSRYEGPMSHTFLFADLCGFCEYTLQHGDEQAAELALAFYRRTRDLAAEEGCDVVKSIGDAVMMHAGRCHNALRVAWRILALSELEGYPPIRVGVDIGPAVERAGDWYGSTVNTAARVTDAAPPGELIMTERARAAIAGSAGIAVVGRGVWRLKGLPAVRLHAAAMA